MDITSGVTNFFNIFSTLYNWMVTNTFIIGGIEFSFASLMWSIIFLEVFLYFLFKVINN